MYINVVIRELLFSLLYYLMIKRVKLVNCEANSFNRWWDERVLWLFTGNDYKRSCCFSASFADRVRNTRCLFDGIVWVLVLPLYANETHATSKPHCIHHHRTTIHIQFIKSGGDWCGVLDWIASHCTSLSWRGIERHSFPLSQIPSQMYLSIASGNMRRTARLWLYFAHLFEATLLLLTDGGGDDSKRTKTKPGSIQFKTPRIYWDMTMKLHLLFLSTKLFRYIRDGMTDYICSSLVAGRTMIQSFRCSTSSILTYRLNHHSHI